MTELAVAKIEYKSAPDESYSIQVPVKANGELISVILKREGILKGRVLVNDEPVQGAVVSIRDSRPRLIRMENETVSMNRTKLLQRPPTHKVTTHLVLQTKSTQFVDFYPGFASPLPLLSSIARQQSDGVYVAPDINLKTYSESATGTVIDVDGQPIEGAEIGIGWFDDTANSWIGFRDQSQLRTDAEGRFALKNIPPGMHEISVNINKDGHWTNAMHKIQAGDRNIRINLNYKPLPPMKRLEPKSVTPIQR